MVPARVIVLHLIGCALGAALNLRTKCGEINGDATKASLYHKHRCYVLTEAAVSVSWPEASLSCTDAPFGGLALWVDEHVFEWFNSTQFSTEWAWTGMFDAEALPNTTHTVKTAMYFTQSGTTNVADAHHIGNESTGIVVHASADHRGPVQPYFTMYAGRVFGWGDELATLVLPHIICQYENHQRIYTKLGGHRLLEMTIAERAPMERRACVTKCTSMPVCQSFAYSDILGECQLYMVGKDDVGNFFHSFLVEDATFDYYQLK